MRGKQENAFAHKVNYANGLNDEELQQSLLIHVWLAGAIYLAEFPTCSRASRKSGSRCVPSQALCTVHSVAYIRCVTGFIGKVDIGRARPESPAYMSARVRRGCSCHHTNESPKGVVELPQSP